MKRILFFLALAVLLTGCLASNTQPSPNGGVYRTKDLGETYEHISNVVSVPGGATFNTNATIFMMFDPTDTNTMYYSSRESGLYVSYDSGTSWRSLLKNKGTIIDLVIDPTDACTLYAISSQNVFKSTDCGRLWDTVYLEKVSGRKVRDLDIDIIATNRLFLSLSDGSLLVSDDSAITWRVHNRLGSNIVEMWVNPQNTQVLYIRLNKKFMRSSDQGLTWDNLTAIINEEFTEGHGVTDLRFIPEYTDGFYTISPYGILKTTDGGQTWEALPLLPQPKKERVLSMAVNPANMNELYYGTANALYYSTDGGVNWQTLQVPSSRQNKFLELHPSDPKTLYIGTFAPPQ